MPALKASDRFESATDDDLALSYCLWPYPRPAPAADKFRSLNLLLHAFEEAGLDERAYDLVEALRDEIGPFRTVYGVKHDASGRIAFELYFYDYARRGRTVSAARVLAALRPLVQVEVAPTETLPYFMFSIDLDAALLRGERALDLVHLYVGNPGSSVSSGIAYAVTAASTMLENLYFFFDATTGLAEAARKVETTAQVDFSRVPLEAVLRPELRRCRSLCVANKRTHDCIYFSGVDVDQLLFFLRRFGQSPATAAFVERHRPHLDHLLFDVGFDYAWRDGGLVVVKSGFYGVF